MNADTLVWNINNVAPTEGGIIAIRLKTQPVTPLGSQCEFRAAITPIADDNAPDDNTRNITETVVGSYDPNDKQFEPYIFTPDSVANHAPLIYTVRFQNTGNFPASFVNITDTLSQNLDPATFRVLASSHTMTWTMEGAGVVSFHFDNINLPDSTANEPASHGFVKYSIEAKPSLQLGDVIENTAYIYFDFNEPVVTNTTVTKVENPSAIFEPSVIEQLIIAPNPTTGKVNITLPNNKNGLGMFRLFSPLGQLILNRETSGTAILLDMSSYAKGVYAIWWEVNGRIYNGKVILN